MERELPLARRVVTVGYVGRRGLHLQREADINQPTIATSSLANPGVALDALRPYKGYNSIRETDNVRQLDVQLAAAELEPPLLPRLRRSALAYTLSKSMDDGSAQRDIIPNTYDAAQPVGTVGFRCAPHLDRQLPLRTAVLPRRNQVQPARLLGGWQVSGITQFQTGTPCGVAAGNDYAGVGQDGSMSTAAASSGS